MYVAAKGPALSAPGTLEDDAVRLVGGRSRGATRRGRMGFERVGTQLGSNLRQVGHRGSVGEPLSLRTIDHPASPRGTGC